MLDGRNLLTTLDTPLIMQLVVHRIINAQLLKGVK